MNKDWLIQKLTSRKLWLGVAGLVFAVINDPAGLNLSEEAQTTLAASPVLAIISEGLVDLVRVWKHGDSKNTR